MADPAHVPTPAYIDVDRVLITNELSSLLGDKDAESWLAFTKALSSVVNLSYHTVREELRSLAHEEEVWSVSKNEERRQQSQVRYLAILLDLIHSAQYEAMSEEMFEYGANAQNFSLGLHAEMGLDLCTPNPLLERLLSRKPLWREAAGGREIPLYCNSLLLFCRGLTVKATTGYFFTAKINVALEMLKDLVSGFFISVGILGEKAMPRAGTEDVMGKHGCADKTWSVQSAVQQQGFFKSLLQRITMHEMCYQRLLIVHPSMPDPEVPVRQKGTTVASVISTLGKKAKQLASAGEARESGEEVQDVVGGVTIECYEDLPVRNLGLVLPNRLVTTSNMDVLQFAFEVIATLFVLRQGIDAVQSGNESTGVTLFLLSLICTCLYRFVMVVMNWYWAVDYYKNMVKEYTTGRLHDKGGAAVNRLFAQVQDQLLKEIELAYWILWQRGPLTSEELDASVEEFLDEAFATEVNFDVTDALEKLMMLRLVEEGKDGKLHISSTPSEYIAKRAPQWCDFMKHFKPASP